jgi:hypothetical protein
MSLVAVAIVVSVTSAVFTASNVVISLFAYRRVMPRLKIQTVLCSLVRNGEKTHYVFRIVSRTQNPVTVKEVRLKFRDGRWVRYRVQVFEWSRPWRLGEEFENIEMEPFGIHSGSFFIDWSGMFRGLPGAFNQYRIEARLSNNLTIHGRWHRRPPVVVVDEPELESSIRQLTFEDLEGQ